MNVSTNRPSRAAGQRIGDPATLTTAIQDWTTAIKNWVTVMTYLMARHFDRRKYVGRLGPFLTLAEPVIAIGVFYVIRGLIRGVGSAYGTSPLLFVASGIFPFYLFVRTALYVRKTQLRAGSLLPRILSMDRFIATTVVNAMIYMVAIVVVFFGMWAYGIERARPESVSDCLSALVLLILLGVGFGLINSTIVRYFPGWRYFAAITTRGLIFFSGVIHIPDFYRVGLRDWLAWNPVLHGVSWFRVGVYGTYPDLLLDRTYLLKCAIILLFIGIVADRASLRRTEGGSLKGAER